ncbi:MAG: T9SS type A sorting domain-containing protein [Ignavibacteria bacterium]|nr:T9SS type A sorting domain-containing protein [Ignavibacteria bacterium]
MRSLNKYLYIPLVLFTLKAYSQVYSDINYSSGTTIDIGAGADVCADNIYITGTFSGAGTICTGALPVTLSSFGFTVEKNNIKLNWVTEWELNNSGFELERKETKAGSIWDKIAFITGGGTTQGQKFYNYEDKKLKAGNYNYRLKQVDYNGSYEFYELNGTAVIKGPTDFKISQNYPNPSNPKCKIDYEIPFDGRVSIKVYDLLGKEVTSLVNEYKTADFYTAEFDGSNLASGMYFYRIIAEGGNKTFTKTLKMALVK